MSRQSPYTDQAIGLPSLRRRRTLIVLGTSLITLYLLLRFTVFSRPANQADEMRGLLYMVSKTENLLPLDLDVNTPVTPSTWSPRDAFNPKVWKKHVSQLDKDSPVIVFSKSYCPFSKRAKELLARYELTPAPHFIEVDLRDDSDIIKRLLNRLTGRATFPNVILRGKSLGGYDNLQALHDKGDLEKELKKAGVRIMGNIHEG